MTDLEKAARMALEALEDYHEEYPPLYKIGHMENIITALRQALSNSVEQPAQQQKEGFASPGGGYVPAIPRPMPLDWKFVPRKATPEMLKAMDECAQEGYDERLYAGMASSVYMAAWDASPVMGTLPEQPAQQEPLAWKHPVTADVFSTYAMAKKACCVGQEPIPLYTSSQSKPWVELDHDDIHALMNEFFYRGMQPSGAHFANFARAIEAKLKEKNS